MFSFIFLFAKIDYCFLSLLIVSILSILIVKQVTLIDNKFLDIIVTYHNLDLKTNPHRNNLNLHKYLFAKPHPRRNHIGFAHKCNKLALAEIKHKTENTVSDYSQKPSLYWENFTCNGVSGCPRAVLGSGEYRTPEILVLLFAKVRKKRNN